MLAGLILFVGVICAAIGGEFFVRGTVGLAKAAKISPGIIAATIAAFATSSPELTIAVNSAIEGNPQISLGDALGSNVVNVALVLAAAVTLAPIAVPRGSIRRDFPVALVAPIGLGVMLIDGHLSRFEGFVLLAAFAGWIAAAIAEARAQRSAAGQVLGQPNRSKAILESIAGLVLLLVAGKMIVEGASDLAKAYGLSQFVIGATIVAIGTSVPELATALISRLRGHDEVGLGTILGSNIFNGLFVIGVASTLHPFEIGTDEIIPSLVLGLTAVALTYPSRSGVIDRWRGGILLALYAVYLTATLSSG